MKTLIGIVLTLIAIISFAAITASDSVEDAQKVVLVKCVEGCIVLSPKDIAQLEENVNKEIAEARKQGLLSCRNAI